MNLTWKAVVLVTTVVAGVVVLALFEKDTTAYIGLAIAILLGVGVIHQQGEIKNATNGIQERLLKLMESMTERLAAQQPPALPPSDATVIEGTSTDRGTTT